MYSSLLQGTLFTITDMIKGGNIFFCNFFNAKESWEFWVIVLTGKCGLCPEGSKGCEGSEIFSFVTLFMVSL